MNGCRQNESPNSWLKQNNNHKTAGHQLTFCEIKSCVFVINKSVIKTFLALNCFQLKYCMSPLSIIFIFQWKSSIVWIRREICTDEAPFALKLVQKRSSQICGWSLMWEDKKWWLFHCRNCYYDYGLIMYPEATVWNSNLLMMDLFLISTQLFNWQDATCWTGVVWFTCGLLWCFYQLFGLILTAPIHCSGSIGEQVT